MGDILVGAAITFVFGLLGKLLADSREHHRWLRQERLRAYSEFIGLADTETIKANLAIVIDGGSTSLEALRNALPEIGRASAKVQIVGPAELGQRSKEVVRRFLLSVQGDEEDPSLREAREAFIDAARHQIRGNPSKWTFG